MTTPAPGKSSSYTYALNDEGDEQKLETIDVLAFKKDGESYTYAFHASGTPSGTVGSDGTQEFTFVMEPSSDTYQFEIIANAQTPVSNLTKTEGVERSSMMSDLTMELSAKWNATTGAFAALPMWGRTDDINVTSATEHINDVTLLRSLARIDVKVADANFMLTGVYIYNSKDKASLVPDASALGTNEVGKMTVKTPTVPGAAANMSTIYSGDISTKALERELYIFESAAETNADDNTFLVIKGKYNGGTDTYYRLDFLGDDGKGNANAYKPVLRNHQYVFNITKVSGDGYASAEIAKANPAVNMTGKMEVWDESVINYILFNGQYRLGTSVDEITEINCFDINNDNATSQTLELIVGTDYSGGWTASSSASWLTISTTEGSNGQASSLKFNVADNLSNLNRSAIITLKAGLLSKKITVQQNKVDVSSSGSHNCHLLQPNKVYILDQAISSSSIYTQLLWTTNPEGVNAEGSIAEFKTVRNRYAIIKTGSKHGNSLLVYGNSIQNTRHIWVTDYDPDKAGNYVTLPDGRKMMTRNLGSLSETPGDINAVGMYYQWGRKFPFNGTTSYTNLQKRPLYDATGKVLTSSDTYGFKVENVTLANNVTNAANSPTTFFKSSASWEGTNTAIWSTKYWGMGTTKGDYDPCPVGWRVPDSGDSSGLPFASLTLANTTYSSSTYSYTNATIGRFVTTGFLHGTSDGVIDQRIQNQIIFYTANPNAYFQIINGGGDITYYGAAKAHGFPVRCVKE